MRYEVTLDGQTRELLVDVTPDGRAAVTMDGRSVDADITQIPGGVSVRLGGKVFDVLVGGGPAEMTLAAGPHRAIAVVESERMKALRRKKGRTAGASGKEVLSPMPGRVVKLLVALGDEVEAGQAVVVVEAMKMENELRAGEAGKVTAIECSEGDSVESGALLVRLG